MRINSPLPILGALLLGLIIYSSSSEPANNEKPVGLDDGEINSNQLPQVIKSVSLDKEYNIAGELVPTNNFDVLERFERELLVNSYWHSSTLLNIKHAQR